MTQEVNINVQDKSLNHNLHIHCIGVGGCGVGALAHMLSAYGVSVSGSDLVANKVTQYLQRLKIPIAIGHHQDNLPDNSDCVVVSTAIADDNPELVQARKMKIPIMHRAQMLAKIFNQLEGIAITGTHGKTTCTGMSAKIFNAAYDASFMIGGSIDDLVTGTKLGGDNKFVIEADESDGSFCNFYPHALLITNIDKDHLECFDDSFAKLFQSFVTLIANLDKNGTLVLCKDDRGIQQLIPTLQRNFITYGTCENADYKLVSNTQIKLQNKITVRLKDQQYFECTLNIPGQHNALNATGVIALACELKVPLKIIKHELENFYGVARRFEIYPYSPCKNITVIEDYGHHPLEIDKTLNSIKDVWKEQRMVVIFQPHRYTRTRDFFTEFVESLSQADVVVLLNVYSASEQYIPGADSAALCAALVNNNKKSILVANDDLASIIELLQENDIVVVQGAGNIGTLMQECFSLMRK